MILFKTRSIHKVRTTAYKWQNKKPKGEISQKKRAFFFPSLFDSFVNQKNFMCQRETYSTLPHHIPRQCPLPLLGTGRTVQKCSNPESTSLGYPAATTY